MAPLGRSLAYAVIAGGLTLVMTVLLFSVVFQPVVDGLTGANESGWQNDSRGYNSTVQDYAVTGQEGIMKVWNAIPAIASVAVFFTALVVSRRAR